MTNEKITKLTELFNTLSSRYQNTKLENKSLYQQNQLLRQSHAKQTLKIEKIEKKINHLLTDIANQQNN